MPAKIDFPHPGPSPPQSHPLAFKGFTDEAILPMEADHPFASDQPTLPAVRVTPWFHPPRQLAPALAIPLRGHLHCDPLVRTRFVILPPPTFAADLLRPQAWARRL